METPFSKKPIAVIDSEVKNCSARAFCYGDASKPIVVFEQLSGIKSLTNALEEIIAKHDFNTGYSISNSSVKWIILQKDEHGLYEIEYELSKKLTRNMGISNNLLIKTWRSVKAESYEVLFL